MRSTVGAAGTWHGTDLEGWYSYSDGGGDRFDLAWDASALAGLVFDHESERAESDLREDERSPRRWLPGVTGPAKALALGVAPGLDNNVTAGIWTNDTTLVLSDPLTSFGAVHGRPRPRAGVPRTARDRRATAGALKSASAHRRWRSADGPRSVLRVGDSLRRRTWRVIHR